MKIKFALMAVIVALLTLSMSGCGCWTDQQKMNTTGCIVLRDLVDCTSGAVTGALPYFASIVGGLISGGTDPNNIPWGDIETQAAGMGIKAGGCFLAELKDLVFHKPSATPAAMAKRKAVEDSLSAYKLKHFGRTNVKFKIKDKDGREAYL